MELTLTLPLPHRGLRPNSVVKWQVRYGLTQQAREKARRAMFEAAKQIDAPAWIIRGYTLKGYFKTKRHWDQGNLLASIKGIEDGIADTAKQDDKTFKVLGIETYTDTKNPRLELVLEIEELV